MKLAQKQMESEAGVVNKQREDSRRPKGDALSDF